MSKFFIGIEIELLNRSFWFALRYTIDSHLARIVVATGYEKFHIETTAVQQYQANISMVVKCWATIAQLFVHVRSKKTRQRRRMPGEHVFQGNAFA